MDESAVATHHNLPDGAILEKKPLKNDIVCAEDGNTFMTQDTDTGVGMETEEAAESIAMDDVTVDDEGSVSNVPEEAVVFEHASIRVERMPDDPSKGFCSGCKKVVSYRNYKRHLAMVHKLDFSNMKSSKTSTKCIHPDCDRHFYHIRNMMLHLENDHSVKVESKELVFLSWDEFLLWKSVEEDTNFVYFTKRTGERNSKGGNKALSYYVCQRDGADKVHRRKDEKFPKTERRNKKGRVKQGLTCPARIVVHRSELAIKVKYTFSHNHPITLKDTVHQPLSVNKLATIKAKLEQGINTDRIMAQLAGVDSDSVTDPAGQEKRHIVPRRRIDDIKKQMDNEKRLDINEQTSVHLLLMKLQEARPSPIVSYRCDGLVNDEGHLYTDHLFDVDKVFLVVYQSEKQLEMMKLHASKLLIIDCDNLIDNNRNQLVNVLVADEFQRVYPVAHMITNSLDQSVLHNFFSSLRERCPELQISIVFTNSDPMYINALSTAFPHCVKIRQFYGRWDTIRQWEKRMKTMIFSPSMRKDVTHFLSTMLDEPNQGRFEVLMDVFGNEFAGVAEKFVRYFDRNFAFEAPRWAMCYRDFPQFGSNRDEFMRAFFTRMEWYTTERPTSKRVDDLINLLIRIDDEWFRKRVNDLAAVQAPEVPLGFGTKLRCSKHSLSEKIPDEDVQFAKLQDIGVWLVKSQPDDEKMYFVKIVRESCESEFCWGKCYKQGCFGLCCHLYSCSCDDESMMCEHVHKVRSLQGHYSVHKDEIASLNNYELTTTTLEVLESNGERKYQHLHGFSSIVNEEGVELVLLDGSEVMVASLETVTAAESVELEQFAQGMGMVDVAVTVPATAGVTGDGVAAYEQVK